MLYGPLFDVVDTDKDGFVTLEETKLGYEAMGWGAEPAKFLFQILDKTNCGKISREDYIKFNTDYWLKIDLEPTQAQDFLNSQIWCFKMEEFVFKKADIDGDGYISAEDRKTSMARIIDYAQKQGVDETTRETCKATAEEFTSVAHGVGSDRVSKDDWLKKVAEVAAADLERIKKGEKPLLSSLQGPFFDVMDTDKDGFVTLEEYKLGYVAIGWDAAGAESGFKFIDTTKSGKISRERYIKSTTDFWYKLI